MSIMARSFYQSILFMFIYESLVIYITRHEETQKKNKKLGINQARSQRVLSFSYFSRTEKIINTKYAGNELGYLTTRSHLEVYNQM